MRDLAYLVEKMLMRKGKKWTVVFKTIQTFKNQSRSALNFFSNPLHFPIFLIPFLISKRAKDKTWNTEHGARNAEEESMKHGA
jgi:amino acid permease